MNQFIEDIHLDKLQVRRFGIAHDDPQITDEEKIRYDACILQLPGMNFKCHFETQTDILNVILSLRLTFSMSVCKKKMELWQTAVLE